MGRFLIAVVDMLSAFADEASVRDEGRDMIGRTAIHEWIDDTTRK